MCVSVCLPTDRCIPPPAFCPLPCLAFSSSYSCNWTADLDLIIIISGPVSPWTTGGSRCVSSFSSHPALLSVELLCWLELLLSLLPSGFSWQLGGEGPASELLEMAAGQEEGPPAALSTVLHESSVLCGQGQSLNLLRLWTALSSLQSRFPYRFGR